jgi:hypothetical protein
MNLLLRIHSYPFLWRQILPLYLIVHGHDNLNDGKHFTTCPPPPPSPQKELALMNNIQKTVHILNIIYYMQLHVRKFVGSNFFLCLLIHCAAYKKSVTFL